MSDLLRLILKKREGLTLNDRDIDYWISSLTSRSPPPDYQIASLLAFIYQQGMNEHETAKLTQAMRLSGTQFDYKTFPKGARFIDKHSTGGVGDKITIPLMPLVLACDESFYYPTIAGRGLGHTGGTVDKLESIPGFQCGIPMSSFYRLLKKNRGAFLAQTKEITPADRILYSLRDVTGTVESIPLITASILSKKLSESLDFLILDIKYGNGAFLPRLEETDRLAKSLLHVATHAKVPANVFITRMDTPLGAYTGHLHEIYESLRILKGEGPVSSTELTFAFAERFLVFAGMTPDRARRAIEHSITTGRAFDQFVRLIEGQGGSLVKFEKLWKTKKVKRKVITAPRRGTVLFDVRKLGYALMEIGGGRKTLKDKIDTSAGLYHPVESGDFVQLDQELLTIYYRSDAKMENALRLFTDAIRIVDEPLEKHPLIRKVLTA